MVQLQGFSSEYSWVHYSGIVGIYPSKMPALYIQVHLFMQEHEKESPGGLTFPAKIKNKDNIHKMQKMITFISLI